MILRFAFCILHSAIITFLVAGCSYISLPSMPWSSSAVQSDPAAEALFEEGMTYFKNKRYVLAIDRFQRIQAEFPFSPELIAAELKIGEAYYLNKQYPEAVAALKEFQSLHPTNENIPFVLYHLGLAYSDQFTAIDRDQKTTEIAKGYFETVVRNHPKSPYAEKAREKLAQCLEYLAEHQFHIASFYFREQKYPAAIDRFEEILRRYRETSTAPKSLYYLGESYRLDENPLKAALAYEALIRHYPQEPLAQKAQAQLGELSREKQDPLALLLKRDGRPSLTLPPPPPVSSQQSAVSGQQTPQSGEIENRKSKIENLNLVAKKDVVHEEANERGFVRRVGDTLNPFSWFSSSDGKQDSRSEKVETARKEESSGLLGFFWKGKSQPKKEPPPDPELVKKVDESLQEKGIEIPASQPGSEIRDPQSRGGNLEIRPPEADLPQLSEAPAPPPTDMGELLGRIDANLKKEGGTSELPPPPEAASVFEASRESAKAATPEASEPSSSAVISGIDEALKRKGIDPTQGGEQIRVPGDSKASRPSSIPASQPSTREKIELDTKLTLEKGPLFLEPGEFREKEKPREGRETKQPASRDGRPVDHSTSRPESAEPSPPTTGLPEAVVKGPPQPVKGKPAEPQVETKKKSPDEEEESKGALDQLKEDLERLRGVLNPFSW